MFATDGTVLGRQDYGPFGQPLFPAPQLSPERFGGNTTDDGTQQAYFHGRQLQSRTGRFTSVDPMYAGLFDPRGWNRYAYAANNPARFVDPVGRSYNLACEALDCRGYAGDLPGGVGNSGINNDGILVTPGLDPGGDGGGTTGSDPGKGNPGANPTPVPTPKPRPNPPGPPGPQPNPCHSFATGIVYGTAAGIRTGGCSQTGDTLINMALSNPWRIERVSSATLKPSLTDFGQLNGAFHHFTFQVGAAMSKPGLIAWFTTIDVGQSLFSKKQGIWGTGESVTEVWDDIVGLVVAGEVGYGTVTGDLATARRMVVRTICK